ncbi:MAG TPA: hypothetical protein VJU82_17910 [Acidobacteriaceae bacterium]|nr:hypothetical protein [Acidobacteriaceae bacterium]
MPTEELAIPICRHLKTNGLRCQSPALNGEPFCYFHVRLHKHHPAPLTAHQIVDARNRAYEGYEEALIGGGEDPMLIARAYPTQNEFNFPPLEDAESIQLAASMLFHAIAQGHIHLRRARLLRDMLRVAAMSCRLNKPNPETATVAVREIDHTSEGLAIARADASSSPGPEEPSAPEAVAIAPADPPSQPADSAPVQASVSEPPQPSAPELPSSASEPTSNQDLICNPLGHNILPEPPALTSKASRFCDFFDAGYGSPRRDLGGQPTLNAMPNPGVSIASKPEYLV